MDGDKDILISDRINGNIIFEQKGDDFDEYDIPSSGEIIGADHIIADLDDDGDFDLIVIGSDGIYALINIVGNYRQTVVSFFDKNENGLFDENENILRDIEFKIDPSTIYGFSGEDGVYDFFLNQIEYEISYISNEKWTYTIEPVVNVLGGEELDTIFYGLKPLQEFSELGVDVGGSIPRCSFVSKYWSSVVNDGTLPVNSVFQITLDTLMSLVDIATISPMPDSIVERTIYWSVPTLEPTEQQKFEFYVQLPNEDFFGEQLTIKGRAIAMEPQLDTTEYSLVNILRCAYDPNDKRVVPMGEFDEGFVQLDQELEYTVRFQNTGNDTAFTVLITDQLSNNLDQSTFEFISASHEVVYAINDGREISFLFEDIMLPDSTTNEQESHGFVKFKIKPDKDINENAIVRNRAEIFFDFNQPIITDFTRNTFVSIIPIDIDGDGWFSDLDCNDMNNEVNPGQIEIPYNGIDDDCNPDTYDDDIDQDGYLFDDDCDDNDFASNPGELEIPYDFIDNDCNPLTLDDDLDQDGFFLLDPFDYDCDDDNPNINPGALEIPNNGVDEDCDGLDLISSIHEIANVVINIYPNPASDQVNIAVEGNLNFKASLFDWNGKLFTEIINKYHIRIDHIPAGVYLLEVKDLNSTEKVVERIIIWR